MPRIKCPFCGKNGAFLDHEMLKQSSLTCESITCKNPACQCYDPIEFGFHQEMGKKQQKVYETYLQAREKESDFPGISLVDKTK